MSRAKGLDVVGNALVLLSAFAEIFILDFFKDYQMNGYIVGIMENQSWLADMLRDIALGVDMGDLDQNSFSEARSSIQLYSQTYNWETELFFARLVVGTCFVIGAVMLIAGKWLAKESER